MSQTIITLLFCSISLTASSFTLATRWTEAAILWLLCVTTTFQFFWVLPILCRLLGYWRVCQKQQHILHVTSFFSTVHHNCSFQTALWPFYCRKAQVNRETLWTTDLRIKEMKVSLKKWLVFAVSLILLFSFYHFNYAEYCVFETDHFKHCDVLLWFFLPWDT